MPSLAGLRSRGVSAQVLSTNDAVTHPALRAAFTGRVNPPLWPLLANLARGRPRLDSVLDQADVHGVSVATMSDGSLDQFAIGAVLPQHEGGSDYEQDLQDTATRSALRMFVDGQYDFVVAHVTYSDHAAHAHGIFEPEYRSVFERIDALVGEVDATVSAEDTLAVIGDHGHDEQGNHGPGLDVPTTSIYRGPAFRQGVELGVMSITDNRYFMSFALGLPLASAYQGGRHPGALAAQSLPPDYRAQVVAVGPVSKSWLLLLIVHAALFAAIWLFQTQRENRRAVAGAWLVAIPALFVFWSPYNSLVGIFFALVWLVRYPPPRVRSVVVLVLAFGALVAWGHLLGRWREAVHEPTTILLERASAGVAGAGLVASLFVAPELVTWVIGGATLLLAYPTVYRYGAFGAVTPLWGMLLLFSTVPDLRRWLRLERGKHSERTDARLRLLLRLALGGAAYLLVSPFLHSESRQFTFEAWSGTYTPNTVGGWFMLGAIGKLVVFAPTYPWKKSSVVQGAAGLGFAVLFTLGDTGVLHLDHWFGLSIVVLTAAAWMVARSAPIERVFWLAMVYAMARFTMRIPLVHWAWADAFYAATILTALSLGRSADPRVAVWGRRCLILLGVVASGWVTIAWTVHGLEWEFLSEWMSNQFVDTHLLYFLPLLLARYLLPVLVVRRVVDDILGRRGEDWMLLRGGGLKLLGTTAVALGIASFSVASDVYVEAFQENGLWLILLAGLFLASRSRRDTAPATEPSGPAV